MAKLTLTFDTYEEQEEIQRTLGAHSLAAAVWQYDQSLRSTYKHSEDLEKSERAYWARSLLREYVDGHDLDTARTPGRRLVARLDRVAGLAEEYLRARLGKGEE